MRSARTVVLAAVMVTVSSPLIAQEPTWQGPLRRQMQRDENCTVAFFGEVVERIVPGQHLVRAKVTCADRRVFTVEQNGGPEQPFRITLCNREGPSC